MENGMKKNNNIESLNNIIKNHCKSDLQNNCVVHIRVGDVLEKVRMQRIIDRWVKTNQNNEFPHFWNPIQYIETKQYYLSKILKLKNLNVNKIIIIAGSHINLKSYKKSIYYIDLVKNLFQRNNIKVILQLGSHPDNDVCLVYNSKYFLPGKGGYSRLLKEIAEYNNKTII